MIRRLLAAALTATLASGVGVVVTTASTSPAGEGVALPFTCMRFQDPTVQYAWSHVCRF